MRGDYDRVRKREQDLPEETREEGEERLQREKILEERRRERREKNYWRQKMLQWARKARCEKVAFGMASTGAGGSRETMFDDKLFNQVKGMDSGFATDDQYNVYDKGLYRTQSAMTTLYRPRKNVDADMHGGANEQLDKTMKTDPFKPDNAFAVTPERARPRDRPVEFEKDAEAADPFGPDECLSEVKRGKKAMNKIGADGQ